SIALPPRPDHLVEACVALVLVTATLFLPWRRLPSWVQAVPPLAFFVPLALLRGPVGEATGFGLLAMLPVLWLALYGTRRQLALALGGLALVYVVPAVSDDTPLDLVLAWRRAVLWVLVTALVGVTVRRLVASLAERERAAGTTARRLAGVLDAATDYSVIGTDTRGRIELFNAGAERMLGWQAPEVLGRSCTVTHEPDELAARARELGTEPFGALIAGLGRTSSARRACTYVRKDGSTVPVELTLAAVRDDDDRVTGYIGIAQDVTVRRAAERQLRDSEANLAAVARVVRGIQTGADVRDAVVEAVLEIAAADGAYMVEPDGRGHLVITRSAGTLLRDVVIPLDGSPSAVATTFLSGRGMFLPDPAEHTLVSRPLLELTGARSMMLEPVRRRGDVVGVLVVSWDHRVGSLTDRKAAAVALLADEASAALEHDDLVQRLATLAATDPLTGLSNRRAWDERVSVEMSRSTRDGKPLTIALLDLDHFKAFNDTFGHQAGDELLAGFATAAGRVLRRVDLFARWGGEEFVLALPGCDVNAAPDVLERVRATVPRGQTCSAGFAQWDGVESLESLLARADGAMYEAKQGGRDRLVAAAARGGTMEALEPTSA
ncbi:MAG TPA: diguanylate cyclase, partial [Actinomycetales bacterium]|nr:diguanylate cyclase [Actinomycetales bacterium]